MDLQKESLSQEPSSQEPLSQEPKQESSQELSQETKQESKQESTSRQSSILKPTKQRVPLQCVAANPSSTESSPTIKIKRRVSFAKNRHIREFVNSAEQGTVWDNTYEENDLSSTKSSNNEQSLVISVPCDEKENFPAQLFMQNNDLDNLEIEENYVQDLNYEKEKTVFCNDSMEITCTPSELIIPYDSQNTSQDTICQDDTMDITDNLPVTINTKSSQENVDKENILNESLDITPVTSDLLAMGFPNQQANQISDREQSKYLNLEPMEFTSVLPSSTWIRSENANKCNKTEIFNNNSMESTEIIQKVPIQCKKQEYSKTEEIKQNLIETENDKTRFFNDQTMEFTNYKPKILQNCFNNKAESALNSKREKEISDQFCMDADDRTKLYDKTMEFTSFVPKLNMNFNKKSKMDQNLLINNINNEQTEFLNRSMEFTSYVPKIIEKQVYKDFSENNESDNKTEYINKSMEFTNYLPQSQIHKKKLLESNSCNTKSDFLNKSMELTNFIPRSSIISKIPTERNYGNQKENETAINAKINIKENLKNFNVNMELKLLQAQQSEKNEIENEKSELILNTSNDPDNKTKKINISMELTSFVPQSFSNKNVEFNKMKQYKDNDNDDRTKYLNMSMELTSYASTNLRKNEAKSLRISPYNKTKLLNNSMELTNVVSAYSKIKNVNNTVTGNQVLYPEDKTEIFNKSMEFTSAVPQKIQHQFNHKQNLVSWDQKIDNETRGRFEAPQCKSLQIYQEEERTEFFNNKSMEFTAIVPQTCKNNIENFGINYKESNKKSFEHYACGNVCNEYDADEETLQDSNNWHYDKTLKNNEENTNNTGDFYTRQSCLTESVSEQNNIKNKSKNINSSTDFNNEQIKSPSDQITVNLLESQFEIQKRKSLDDYQKEKSTDFFNNKSMEFISAPQSFRCLPNTSGLNFNESILDNLTREIIRDSEKTLNNVILNQTEVLSNNNLLNDNEDDRIKTTRIPNNFYTSATTSNENICGKNNEQDVNENTKPISSEISNENLNPISNTDSNLDSNDDPNQDPENNETDNFDENFDSDSDKENCDPGFSSMNNSMRCLFPNNENEDIEDIEPPSIMVDDEDDEDIEDVDVDEDEDFKSSFQLLEDPESSNDEESQSTSNQDHTFELLQIKKDEFIHCSPNKKSRNHSAISFNNETEKMIKDNTYDETCNLSTNNSEFSLKLQEKSSFLKEKSILNETDVTNPFTVLEERLKTTEISHNCIWSLKTIDKNKIIFEFISKSFLVIIKLNEFEKECSKDIEKIQIVSRLKNESKNILLKIVHKQLIIKLDSNKLMDSYKMYEDVPLLLEHISNEVIFEMNIMFDLEKLKALNLMDINEDRISFYVASTKGTIILHVVINLRLFNEIKASDIEVACILGNIRINNIQQLISNIKKDEKLISRYLSDIKDLLAVMEETNCHKKY